jgi:hypothetical protein
MALESERLKFILLLTDYFHGHWEDPSWGTRAENQVLIALAVHELSGKIADAGARARIQEASAGIIAKQSETIVGSAAKAGR